MKNKLWGKRVLAIMATATLALPLIAGCTASEAKDTEQRVLRVATLWGGQDDSYFRQQFTDAFELTHPNVTIEIVAAVDQSSMYGYGNTEEQPEVPDTMESLKKIMTGDNPVDVIVADTATVKSLIQENLVKQLDPLMQEDKFDTSDIVPSVLEGIKDLGDQSIYALTPTFSSSALFYNKGLFEKAGVEPPTDNMTWDDIFNLGTRLTKGEGKDHVFGFSFTTYQGGSPYYSMQQYYSSLQLKTFDDKAEKMTVDSPQWEKVWSTISKLAIDKVIPKGDEPQDQDPSGRYDPVQGDLFLSGKSAMVIGDYSYINQLIDANKNADKMKDFTKVDWDVVTPPVHPEAPEIGGNIYLSNLMAINSAAQNPDDAWELIKYMNSEDWAKIKARSSYEMVSRKSFIKPKDGLDYNIQAFYSLKPIPPTNTNLDKMYQKSPGLWQVNEKGMEYFNQVLENKKTPKEALGEWAAKGNEMLEKLKKDPKATFQ
ncbi:extracellular solute-binding protein [Paenibacillus sp. FSL R5-0341]|uniref:ABC transporter substrate-binding protein n=1 Tax=unclassified Paenibacillus TaxID=185978 RepID=UPI0030D15C50